jgi:hypothetical protein
VYTLPGAQQRVAAYYASLGVDGAGQPRLTPARPSPADV